MASRVFLHVGTPKSGTTYLQTILWQNVARLKTAGLLVPGRFETHYVAAKAVTGRPGMRRETRTHLQRAWPKLARQTRSWPGDALVSHELFAPARAEQAQAARASLGDCEVHLVLTARALHSQLPASWQEQVKSGLPTPYDVYLTRVRDEQAKGAWFWEVQDLPAIARRWAGHDVPPERVHVVTVPPDRSDPTLLWRRYASVLDIDPAGFDTATPPRNASLGLVESELLRRVHEARDPRFSDGARHRWTRKLLATRVLADRAGERLRLPGSSAGWVADRSAEMRRSLEAAGYDVVGDLDDLGLPATDAGRYESVRSPESVTSKELGEAAAWTIDRLVDELMSRRPPWPTPTVSSDSGVRGILELLEHIRASDTGEPPRPDRPWPRQRRGAPPRGGALRSLLAFSAQSTASRLAL